MPVIATHTWVIEGVEFTQRITCGRDGIFRAKTPPAWIETLGITEIKGESLDQFYRTWRDTDRKYREAATTTRKVIAYKVESSPDMSFSEGAGVMVYAAVYIEKQSRHSDGEAFYHYSPVPSPENLPDILHQSQFTVRVERRNNANDEFRFLDWTPERHAFFEAIGEAMTQLIEKLKSLNDTSQIDALLASRVPLLPTGEDATRSDP